MSATQRFSGRVSSLMVLAYRDVMVAGGYALGRLEGTDTAKLKLTMPKAKDRGYYRVEIQSSKVTVMYFDYDAIDDDAEGVYDDVHALPEWIQKQVSVLSMLSYTPPTPNIEGVGRRISKDTFWVEKPDSC